MASHIKPEIIGHVGSFAIYKFVYKEGKKVFATRNNVWCPLHENYVDAMCVQDDVLMMYRKYTDGRNYRIYLTERDIFQKKFVWKEVVKSNV